MNRHAINSQSVREPMKPSTDARDEPLIRLERIDYTRNGKTILHDVGFSMRAGEIVTLIGPNGAGKSTLVKIALGLLAPSAGAVARRRGLRVGYVPQTIALDPTLPLTLHRFLRLERGHSRVAIERVLTQIDIAALRDAPLQSLSGGEMRRALLARALLRDPDLLILDEPSAGMDIHGQTALYRLIQTIRAQRRCGILLVSHDLYMVMAATDRVLCLNRHLCCSGQPADVRRHPEFIALFGARAAAELGVYHHRHDHAHGISGEIESAGTEVTGAATDAAIDAPTDAPIYAPINAPIDSPIDAPTNAPINTPTDTPTNTPIDDAPTDDASANQPRHG